MNDNAKVVRLDPETQRHVRTRIARLPAVAHAIYEEGQKQLAESLVEYFEATDDAMFEQADKAANNQEQNMYFDSMREVRVQRKGMEARFFEIIQEAFARLVGDDSRDTLKDRGELSADALSLVQNEDLEQLAALEDIVDKANRQYADTLSEFGKVLSGIVSGDVSVRKNPFGPSVIALAGMAQFRRLDIDVKAKLLLFRLFDRIVVQQLPNLYMSLFDILSAHGLGFNNSLAYISQGQLMNHRENAVSSIEEAEASSQELIELLSFVQTLPATVDSDQSIDVERVLENVQRRKGESLVLGHIESETINLVQMLFQFVSDNEEIDSRMVSLICKLQVPMTKLALLDASFLSRQKHPARLLINELASVALQWCGDGAAIGEPKDPIYTLMKRTVDRIVFYFDRNTDIFKEALADFSAFIEKEARRAAVLERRTIDAEAGKAKSEEARSKVSAEVQHQLMGHLIPESVEKLIKGPWSNVLFVVGLRYGFSSREWQDQLKVLSDLIWSIQPCVDKAAREHLIMLIPGLTANLRAGLDSISYNPFEVSEVFKELEEIHLLRMRGEPLQIEQRPEVSVSLSSATVDVNVSDKAGLDADNMFGEIESLMSGESENKQSSQDNTHAEVPEQSAHSYEMYGEDPHMMTVSGFTQGAWFGFNPEALDDTGLVDGESQEMLRCRLAAIIKQTGKYIFVNRSGMKVAERTHAQLAQALKDGYLRPLDSNLLFDKALENVVSGLRKSSTGMPGLGSKER